MSEQIPTVADLFARPTEIEEGSYLRIRQIRPVERAAAPIVDHNIILTETALALRPWYRGESAAAPQDYLSDLLDPHNNNAVVTLADFTKTIKAFPPGAFPAHCHAVRTLEFTTKHLVATLGTIFESPVFNNALRSLGAFFAAISDPANLALSRHDFDQRVTARLERMIDSFNDISREFNIRERSMAFSELPLEQPAPDDARTDEILSAVNETRQIVKRIDARDVKRGKRQSEIARQEKCYSYWEIGRQKEAVMKASNGKVTYEAVFDYYRRELEPIGVKSPEAFRLSINRRAKRLSKQKR